MSSICKDCKHKFRNVSIPHRVEEDEEDGVIITVYCVLVGMDLSDGDVVECSHYDREELREDPNILLDI